MFIILENFNYRRTQMRGWVRFIPKNTIVFVFVIPEFCYHNGVLLHTLHPEAYGLVIANDKRLRKFFQSCRIYIKSYCVLNVNDYLI